jgi:hypothetical protein
VWQRILAITRGQPLRETEEREVPQWVPAEREREIIPVPRRGPGVPEREREPVPVGRER